jgi:dTDP-4-dehydrorhamnose 3,5-epimerase
MILTWISKRFYTITHPNTSNVSVWQGHKIEIKCFYVLQGAFKIMLIKPDQWDNLSPVQTIEEYSIKQEDNMVLKIPGGYINGFKATVPNSKLMVFADATLTESKLYDVRFDKRLWYDWTKMSSL